MHFFAQHCCDSKSSNATEHAVQVFALLALVAAADEYQLRASYSCHPRFRLGRVLRSRSQSSQGRQYKDVPVSVIRHCCHSHASIRGNSTSWVCSHFQLLASTPATPVRETTCLVILSSTTPKAITTCSSVPSHR